MLTLNWTIQTSQQFQPQAFNRTQIKSQTSKQKTKNKEDTENSKERKEKSPHGLEKWWPKLLDKGRLDNTVQNSYRLSDSSKKYRLLRHIKTDTYTHTHTHTLRQLFQLCPQQSAAAMKGGYSLACSSRLSTEGDTNSQIWSREGVKFESEI